MTLKTRARQGIFNQYISRRTFARRERGGRRRNQLVPKDPPRQHRDGGGRRSGLLFKAAGVLGFCFSGTMYMYYVMSVGKRGRTEPDWDAPLSPSQPPGNKSNHHNDDDPWNSQPDWGKSQDESLKDRSDPVWGSPSNDDKWSDGGDDRGEGKWA